MALQALDSVGRLTPLGKTMAQYPMNPRHSRLLLLTIQILRKESSFVRPNLVLGYAVAVAAALSFVNPCSFQSGSEGTEQEEDSGFLGSQNEEEQAKLMKKQTKKSIMLSRAESASLKSDALTVAYALQCFERSKNPSQFCQENTLHLKIMVEMPKLRKQLLQLVFKRRYCGLQQEFSWSHGTIKDVEENWTISFDKYPLSHEEEDVLCQAICCAYADPVAKRIRRALLSSEGDRKVNAICYQASSVEETVFLGRWSSVSKEAPEFLVYHEIICTKRPYIHGATSAKPEWLVKHAGSLCTYSAPLTDPKPFYDPHCDQVFNYVIPCFGPHLWELPLSKAPIKDVQQRIIVFAYALLDGQVLPCLKHVKQSMASPPSTILKPQALGQKRVGNLLSKLRSRTIDSCAMLKQAWKEDPQLLYLELLDFFQDGSCWLYQELWEKLHQEAFSVPGDRFLHTTRKRKRKRAL